jgi:hypothetical protein
MSTAKTKILVLKGKELIKARILINNNIIEQVTNFNYLGYKIVILRQKIREYQQQNYFEHILRMPTYQIPRKIFNYHPKRGRGSGRPPMRWIDQFA